MVQHYKLIHDVESYGHPKAELLARASRAAEVAAGELHMDTPDLSWFDYEDGIDLETARRHKEAGQALPWTPFTQDFAVNGMVRRGETKTMLLFVGLDPERVVHTVAHELRHIYQEKSGGYPKHDAEADAECFAIFACAKLEGGDPAKCNACRWYRAADVNTYYGAASGRFGDTRGTIRRLKELVRMVPEWAA